MPTIDVEYLELERLLGVKLLGLKLSAERISELLLTAGLGIEEVKEDSVDVLVPCYRVDVMHQVDLIEDVAIAYGYNNIEPVWRELSTTGKAKPDQRLIDVARELMVGLGYQEILNYTLTNQESLFDKMNVQRERIVEVSNPKVATMTCLRSWLLKSALDSFFGNFGVEWQIQETAHPSFIEGRVGKVIVNGSEIGVVGEISPVLEAWKLENPVAAFEVNLQKIINAKLKNQ